MLPFLSPAADAGKGEEEEKEESAGLGLPASPKNCLPRRGISILEKLVKTCPVWLQLGLARSEAARILHREVAGVSLVPPRGLEGGHPCEGPGRRRLEAAAPVAVLSPRHSAVPKLRAGT